MNPEGQRKITVPKQKHISYNLCEGSAVKSNWFPSGDVSIKSILHSFDISERHIGKFGERQWRGREERVQVTLGLWEADI